MTCALLLAVGADEAEADSIARLCLASLRAAGRKVAVLAGAGSAGISLVGTGSMGSGSIGSGVAGAAEGKPEAGGGAANEHDALLAAGLGLPSVALAAGCPLPFAAELTRWERAAEEAASGRWDVLIVPTGSVGATVGLATAPERLRRVVRAVLDEVGPAGGPAEQVAALVSLDRRSAALTALVLGAGAGLLVPDSPRLAQRRALALLALPQTSPRQLAADPDALLLARNGDEAATGAVGRGGSGGRGARPPLEVRRAGPSPDEGFVWSLAVADAGPDDLALWLERGADGALLELQLDGLTRVVTLPSALRRCRVTGGVVRDRRLDVRFVPDPSVWRWQ